MRISTKCSTAIHVLILIAEMGSQGKLVSKQIAQSTGSNPVIIRTILSQLKKAGYIHVQRGGGGAVLAVDPEALTLGMIYRAVDPTAAKDLIGIHKSPSPLCPVGRNITEILEEPYTAIENTMQKTMDTYTLAHLLARYRNIRAAEAAEQHPHTP